MERTRDHYEQHFADCGRGNDADGYFYHYDDYIEEARQDVQHAQEQHDHRARHAVAALGCWDHWAPPTASQLRHMLHGGTAAGPDQWAPSELMLLPEEALEELADLCAYSEEHGWPTQLLQWRQVHLPKDPDTALPSLTRLRPIAIASAVVRAWHRWRADQLATYLSPAFLPAQGGGLKGRTLESLIEPCLSLIEETIAANRYDDEDGSLTEEEQRLVRERQTELHVKSWDYASAFDRASPRVVCEVWSRLGVPARITNSIEAIWTKQERWVEVGPLLSPRTVLVEDSLPQGDPAAMLGMATMLMGPLRRQAALHPRATFCTFADDRTAATTDGE